MLEKLADGRYIVDRDGTAYRVELHSPGLEITPVSTGLVDPLGGITYPAAPLLTDPELVRFQRLQFYVDQDTTPGYLSTLDIPIERNLDSFSDAELLDRLHQAQRAGENPES